MKPEDIILKYYARKKDISKGRTEARFNEAVSPMMMPHGLGDSVILTDIWGASGGRIRPWSQSRHFKPVMSRVPGWVDEGHAPVLVDVPSAYQRWNLGAGHLLQRVRRMYNLPVDSVPRGGVRSSKAMVPGRVAVHCEAGAHAAWQRANLHPKARRIYPKTMDAIRRFAASRKELEWTTIGISEMADSWARVVETADAAELIDHIATCEWFVGIISGPMHIATALGVKCVVIVNMPDPGEIMLPTLKVLGTVEEEWFYPQNVHLHQDGAGPLVPKFSIRSLAQAFEGEVYPFWKTDWCTLLES